MAIIVGTTNADDIPGTVFADEITGLAGDDTIQAVFGDDLVDGGSGDDSIFGDWGNDTLVGGAGNDALHSGGDNDRIYGGGGDDYIVVNDLSYAGFGRAWGGAGNDFFVIYSTDGAVVRGGTGIDTIGFYSVSQQGLFVDLVNGQMDGHGAFFPGVTFTGMEQLHVSSYGGADTILGGDLADRLEVGGGANTVMAGAGDDLVGYVTTDASTLDGGTGEDTLEVGAGTSSLYFIVDTSDGSVDDGQLSVISSFEYYAAYGGQFDDIASLGSRDDSFRGGFGSDTAFGAGGNDTLIGDQGNDLLSGGDGNDRLVGNSGNDTLTGGDGDDRLAGGIGLDVIDAGAGNDRIAFYLGNDTASGGSGDDWFLFTRNQNGFHTITDFESGADTLGITGIFLQFGPASGALDPALLSFGTASGTPAQFILTYSMVSDLTTLLWDPNGTDPSGGAYAICMFQGNVSLTAQDFFIL